MRINYYQKKLKKVVTVGTNLIRNNMSNETASIVIKVINIENDNPNSFVEGKKETPPPTTSFLN